MLQGLQSTFAPQGAFEEDLIQRLARDLHFRKRGDLFDNSTVRNNEEERIRDIEKELGIHTIKEQMENTSSHLLECKRIVAELSRIPEDIIQAAQSDFGKHRAAFSLIYDELWQSGSLANKMALERAWKLNRFQLVYGEQGLYSATATELFRSIWQKKNHSIQEAEETLNRLSSELKVKEERLLQRMSQDSLRCLLPSIQDLESLDRFYSMHDRKIAKTIDLLLKVQCARLNGQGLIAMKSLPKHGATKPIGDSSSEHDNGTSSHPLSETKREGEDNA